MASGRIKGITVEIGGDATKLNKALSSVDKQLSTTKSTLKDVDKLLKLDPGNVELLAQKQKNLTSAIDKTKDRLDELKKAQGQVKEGTDDWDALQREIIATEQDLKGLQDEYKEFGSVSAQQLKNAGDAVKNVGGKVQDVGKGLTKNVTLPIVAAGGAALAAWNEVDGAMDIIVTKTGASGEALEAMQDSAKNLAETMPTSFEEAATAVGEVNTRFGVTGEELETLSGKFIKFAKINGTDVNSSIDSVQKAMAAFGVGAEEAGDVLDALNVAGQNTGVSVDQLASSLSSNATALKEMGFGITESISFLSELDVAGIDSSTVMSGLQKALKNATAEGKTMDEALAEIQDSMVNATSDTEAMQIATELFGSKAGTAIADFVRDGKLNFTDLSQAVTDFGGSVEQTYEDTLDPMDQMTMAMNTAKDVGYEIGEAMMPLVAEALGTVKDVIVSLKEKWDNLSPDAQETIVKAALIAAAIGPVVTIIGSVISGIGGIMGAISGLMPVLTGTVLPFLAANGPLILGITAVIAVGALLIKNWDKIKETATKVFTAVKDTIKGAIDKVKSILDFRWEFPKPKLPHFSIQGKFSLSPPSVPRLAIDWYAKAMTDPIMFTSPTVIPTASGLKGFGDAGAEVVLSADKLREIAGSGGETTINIYATPGMDVNALADAVQARMVMLNRQRRAGAL